MHITPSLVALTYGVCALASQLKPQMPMITDEGKEELIDKLKEDEIVPQLLDAFEPQVRVGLTWFNASASYGNRLVPTALNDQPTVSLQYWPDDDDVLFGEEVHHQPDYVVVLTDPDAPSYKNPKSSQFCHWITAGVTLHGRDIGVPRRQQRNIVDYYPPGPPPMTGEHRYIAIALTARNRTTAKLELSKPSDRQRWGYDKERAGIREWAKENSLDVIGANWFFAQNAKNADKTAIPP